MINYRKHQLPIEWGRCHLSDVADFLDNKRIPLKEDDRKARKGPYPYYGASGIIDYIDDYIFDEELILLAEDGANILNRATPIAFKATGRFWVNNHAHVLRPKTNADIDYLTYYLESLSYIQFNSGAAQPKLNREMCASIPVVLPSLFEQKAIADLLSTWDEAIEKTERLIQAKEKQFEWMLSALLSSHALAGKAGTWTETTLKQICSIEKGDQKNRDSLSADGAYPVMNGGISPSGYTDTWNTEANTVTISEGGNSCGFVNFMETPFWCGGHCYAIKVLDAEVIDNKFLYFYLKHREKRIMRLRVGSGLPNIQRRDIEKFPVSYPPLDEQQQITVTLSSAQSELDLLKQLVERYKTQKRGLIQKLLTGRWRVTNGEAA